MRQQATRANRAQIERHIKLQRAGMKGEFAHNHPIADAILGSIVLASFIGGMVALWVWVGAMQGAAQ